MRGNKDDSARQSNDIQGGTGNNSPAGESVGGSKDSAEPSGEANGQGSAGRPASPPAEGRRAGIDRRTLCLGVGGIAVLLGLGGASALGSESLVRPPGGQDEDRLLSLCVRCQKCITACKRSVIAPTHVEDGLLNMRTPHLDFTNDYCDWCAEDNDGHPLCVASCPTGALALPEDAAADTVVLGVAELTTDWCLGFRSPSSGCHYCYNACEYEAITLDEAGRPHLDQEKCLGCGACEAVCVSLVNGSIVAGATHRAIIVVPPYA